MHSFSFSVRLKSVWRGLFPCLLTGALLLLVYAVFGFAPFGEKSISWCDKDQQVIPLLAEFRQALLGEGSFFRSPSAGGISYWGIYFFFLSITTTTTTAPTANTTTTIISITNMFGPPSDSL